jgi:hypothetical protein
MHLKPKLNLHLKKNEEILDVKYSIQLCDLTLHYAFKVIISVCRPSINLSKPLKSNTYRHIKVRKRFLNFQVVL